MMQPKDFELLSNMIDCSRETNSTYTIIFNDNSEIQIAYLSGYCYILHRTYNHYTDCAYECGVEQIGRMWDSIMEKVVSQKKA